LHRQRRDRGDEDGGRSGAQPEPRPEDEHGDDEDGVVAGHYGPRDEIRIDAQSAAWFHEAPRLVKQRGSFVDVSLLGPYRCESAERLRGANTLDDVPLDALGGPVPLPALGMKRSESRAGRYLLLARPVLQDPQQLVDLG
jgi:hypothetical protein